MVLLILLILLVLLVLLIRVLILVLLVLVLILVILIISATTLILQHQLSINVILLCIHVCWIPQQRLLISIHGSLPILFLASHVTQIIIII